MLNANCGLANVQAPLSTRCSLLCTKGQTSSGNHTHSPWLHFFLNLFICLAPITMARILYFCPILWTQSERERRMVWISAISWGLASLYSVSYSSARHQYQVQTNDFVLSCLMRLGGTIPQVEARGNFITRNPVQARYLASIRSYIHAIVCSACPGSYQTCNVMALIYRHGHVQTKGLGPLPFDSSRTLERDERAGTQGSLESRSRLAFRPSVQLLVSNLLCHTLPVAGRPSDLYRFHGEYTSR